MPRLLRNFVIVLVVTLIAAASIWPPQKNIRLGKDLSGGVSLVYSVQLGPNERGIDVIPRIIEILKQRVDPNAQSDISMVKRGEDRIEITMPLPSAAVKELKRRLENALTDLDRARIRPDQFEQAMRASGAERQQRIDALLDDRGMLDDLRRIAGEASAAGETQRAAELQAAIDAAIKAKELHKKLITDAAAAYDGVQATRAQLTAAQAELEQARQSGAEAAQVEAITARLDGLVAAAAQAELAYDAARAAVLDADVSSDDVRRALTLPAKARVLLDRETGIAITLPSPRASALQRLRDRYPAAVAAIDRAVAAHTRYVSERRSLDDPGDLKRLLAGSGVLDFRITVKADSDPALESEMRSQFRDRGPRNARTDDVRWFKINKIDGWYDSLQDLKALTENPQAFFAARTYVVEELDGEFYMLCWTTPGSQLTRAEGDWRVEGAFPGSDQFGRPAINFTMDPAGAQLLSRLTANHLGNQMAVLLDDQVYTAPTLEGKISRSGQITGDFPAAELNYIIRTLAAGSLQAKLSPEPISEDNVAPELGLDNLRQGLYAGVISFFICAAFMTFYYFACGLIATTALVLNCTLLVGLMALGGSAFTLPGIAGVILTIAMAVDANVLIYERLREEMLKGADLRTAVRLGYDRALSAIVDGNLTNLIVCIVLYFVGTPEIRGFGLTMSIGVVTTLFTQLFFTRLLFDFFVEKVGWRRTSMLPLAVPAVQRLFHFNVDWMKYRPIFYTVFAGLIGLGLFMIVVRGRDMLATEFVGGTEIAIKLKDTEAGKPLLMTRQEVADRVTNSAGDIPSLLELRNAEIVVTNALEGGTTSNRFRIKSLVTDVTSLKSAVGQAFQDVIDAQPQVRFDGSDVVDGADAPAYPITNAQLGDSIDRPGVRNDVQPFLGGVAIVLDNITPPQPLAALKERLTQIRTEPDFSSTLGRRTDLIILRGDEQAVASAVLVSADAELSIFSGEQRWGAELRDVEWRLVREALTQPTDFFSVQAFSPEIAASFAAEAIGAVVISAILIIIYVWVRFNSIRFSVAAIVPTLLDCVSAIGLIAMAEIIYDANTPLAQSLGLGAFKIDLIVVAAILTILGYSINDKIVVLDRIRENRGKLNYVSRTIVNASINQTMGRTVMTGTTTILSTLVLYLIGGEVLRPFAYSLGLGIVIGTASSVALGAPLVWSRRGDKTAEETVFPPRQG